MIVDDRLWFHSVIQTGDLPSFLQILQIPMSSLLARKIRVRLLFMYFFNLILKSVLLGGFSLRDRQLYLLQVFMPKSGSGLKPTLSGLSIMVLVYAAPINSSLVTNVLFVQLADVEEVLMCIELDPLLCIFGIFCLTFH